MNTLQVELAFADPNHQMLLKLEVLPDCTIRAAIEQSGILEQCPHIDLASYGIGIFSQIVDTNTCLKSGDRIEIYPPLLIDPKTARRRRAQTVK